MIARKAQPAPQQVEQSCAACKRTGVPLEKISSGELDVRVCADWRSCIKLWPEIELKQAV